MEFKKGNTFATTAFCSYGLFCLTLVFLLVFPNGGWCTVKQNDLSFTFYLFMWGLFTLYMFIGTLKLTRALQTVFLTLTILFWVLALAHITGNSTISIIAGWEGIICGLSAIYAAMAQVLNEVYGKTVLPLGHKLFKIKKRGG
jgi:hypothetical protein